MPTIARQDQPAFLRANESRWLFYEKDEAPMHRGFLVFFDQEIELDDLVAHVSNRLGKLPGCLLRPVMSALNTMSPSWEKDPDFALDRHIQGHEVVGDETALLRLAEGLFGAVLERDHPLWQMHLLKQVGSPGSVLLVKVHQVVLASANSTAGKGMSAAAWLQTLFNTVPRPAPAARNPEDVKPPRIRKADPLVARSLEAMDAWSSWSVGAIDATHGWLTERTFTARESLFETMPDLVMPIRRLPFNRKVSGASGLDFCEFSLAEARAIRRKMFGSIDDIVLSVVAGAVRRYALLHNEPVAGRSLRTLLRAPRHARAGSGRSAMTELPVNLPLDTDDPVIRLRAVRETTRLLRSARVADVLDRSVSLLGILPVALQATAGRLYDGRSLPQFHLQCEVSSGSQVPLFLAGQEAAAIVPFVPTGYRLGLSVAAHSYNQRLFIGVVADRASCPDLKVFRKYLNDEMQALKSALDIEGVEAIRSRPRVRAPKKRKGVN